MKTSLWELGEPVSVHTARARMNANRKSLERAARLGYIPGVEKVGTSFYATPEAWREGYAKYLQRPRPVRKPKVKPKKKAVRRKPIGPRPAVDPETARQRVEALTDDQRKALRAFFLGVYQGWWRKKYGNEPKPVFARASEDNTLPKGV